MKCYKQHMTTKGWLIKDKRTWNMNIFGIDVSEVQLMKFLQISIVDTFSSSVMKDSLSSSSTVPKNRTMRKLQSVKSFSETKKMSC